jgi:hypothetical protein
LNIAWQHSPMRSANLVVIESPYRSLAGPLLGYIDALHEGHPDDTLVIVLPEYVPSHWWGALTAQPDRTPTQGGAAVSSRRDRSQRPVPPGTLRGRVAGLHALGTQRSTAKGEDKHNLSRSHARPGGGCRLDLL